MLYSWIYANIVILMQAHKKKGNQRHDNILRKNKSEEIKTQAINLD